MRALVLSAPRKLTLETVPDPTPAPDEAVVQVEFAGICGTDVEIFINDLMHYKLGYAKLPIVPGHEWTGTVVATGREVSGLKAGDRVIAEVAIGCGTCRFCKAGHPNVCADRREVGIINQNGGFAQFACIPAANLRKIGSLAFGDAVLSEPTAVVLNGCRKGQIAARDRVLVVGAGPIGLLALQCAKACGAVEVCVLDRIPERLALAQRLGATQVLDGTGLRPEELTERSRQLTSGEGFDVILECAGSGPLFPHLIPSLARLGRLVVIGCFQEQHPAISPDFISGGERTIVGAIGGGSSYGDAVEFLSSGKVKPANLVTHRFALAEGPKLLASLAERKGPAGALKVLLKP